MLHLIAKLGHCSYCSEYAPNTHPVQKLQGNSGGADTDKGDDNSKKYTATNNGAVIAYYLTEYCFMII